MKKKKAVWLKGHEEYVDVEADTTYNHKKHTKRKKSGKYSRNKGKRFELKVSHMLSARGFDAKRGIQFRGGGEEQPDIICELLRFIHFELKSVEKFNLNQALRQALADKKRGQVPCVVHKKLRGDIIASLPLVDLIHILQWALGYVDNKNTLKLDKYREKMKDAKGSKEECL